MDAAERAAWLQLSQKVEGLRQNIRNAAEQWRRPLREDIDHDIAEIQEMSNRILGDDDLLDEDEDIRH